MKNFTKEELVSFRLGDQDIKPVVFGVVSGEIVPDTESIPELIEAIKLQVYPNEAKAGLSGIAIEILEELWHIGCLAA